MSDTPDPSGVSAPPASPQAVPVATEPPLADVEPIDPAPEVPAEWYDDGGRKTALGVWAGVAVLSYAAMQLTGYFADWPFVALVSGAVAYFCVRGIAVVRGELKRRRQSS